ncbi:dihydroorotate dehydrogenase B (NAD(+)) electron transfer subunit [Ruminococcus sp. CAG:563]|nr:dihydroorotate dehydrogenase B (NAD(+)) electron transfer subunit [Ruminococcus sp. CAG:563]HJI47509.1 dihydroorotate dehydrogenase electron transfer subunit [Oscillospiraceae bacterium]
MNQVMMKITDNKKIAEKTYFMSLEGDTSAITKPGQFINIKLDGFFLRRPISVCDCENGKLSIIYKVVGNGTKEMSELPVGAELDILSGLGNGYDTSKSGDCPVLIGGGVGVPPMYLLCKKLVSEGKKATVILGFNSEKEVFGVDEFKATGAEVYVTTADGSVGTKGFVTDVLKNLDYTYFYTCGPMPMFKAIESIAKTSGQYSFEERMGCGFGACMGCTCKTKYGNKRICKDGPVLEREEIVW